MDQVQELNAACLFNSFSFAFSCVEKGPLWNDEGHVTY